jgi:uncharacterized protein YjbI with pentapeptide repeats
VADELNEGIEAAEQTGQPHFVLLASKAGVFDMQLREQVDDADVRTKLQRQLPINIFVQFLAGPREVREGPMGFLLRLIAWISLVIGPVALLVFFQLQFLPYHDLWITMWQRIAVVIDLALLWLLWPTVLHGEATRRGWRRIEAGSSLMMASISLVSILLVFTIATFPGEWLNRNLPALRFPLVLNATPEGQTSLSELLVAGKVDRFAQRPTSLWSNRLVLPGLEATPEMASLRGRNLEGAVLIGAVLRKVDFTDANFQDANLRTAQFQGASLAGVRLQGASLIEAQLQGADLRSAYFAARLQGVDLTVAHLEGATLVAAQLQGASLGVAQLQGADLIDATLEGANLAGAQLQGASLGGAQLQGAILDYAALEGANLAGAQLQGASLQHVFTWRADVRHTDAQGARVQMIETSPYLPCKDQPGVCFRVDTDSLRKLFERDVPESDRRTEILATLEKKLDPRIPLAGEEEMARRWDELQAAVTPEPDYEEKLAKLWREIGCTTDEAPFVLTGLVDIISVQTTSPFLDNSVQVPKLAADFLKEDCVGARGISEKTRAALIKLRDAVPQTVAKPNTQPAKP